MAEGLLEDQYDADLTVDDDYEYDDDLSYGQGVDDLFGYTDDDSPISKLKSLILSIEWEITDDILEQFIDELLELKTLWKDDQIKLVYIQALDKIARYIYKEKADAKHNAIKLLLAFYRNFEKIVSDESVTSEQAKAILANDIKRFEELKKEIYPAGQETQVPTIPPERKKSVQETLTETHEIPVPEFVDKEAKKKLPPEPTVKATPIPGDASILRELKAAVLGIDWEITNQDLARLANEVFKLRDTFRNSKAKLIFLQGIDTLAGYINLKRSESHAGAFSLLRSFFDGLERVVSEGLTREEEKEILLVRAEKFNKFKKIIADSMLDSAAEAKKEHVTVPKKDEKIPASEKTVPTERSFESDRKDKADTEEIALETVEEAADGAVASELEDRLKGFFDADAEQEIAGKVDSEMALKGVDVESEADDDSDEEPLPMDEEGLAPALSAVDEGITLEEPVPVEKTPAETPVETKDEESGGEVVYEIDSKLKSLFEGESDEDSSEIIDSEIALQGVAVESEADDDSDEEPLPMDEEGLAPALSSFGEERVSEEPIIEKTELKTTAVEEELGKDVISEPAGEETTQPVVSQEIESKLEDLFDLESDDDSSEIVDSDTALQGVDVETEADDDSDEEPLPMDEEGLAPALFSFGEEKVAEQPTVDKPELSADLFEDETEKKVDLEKEEDESSSEEVISEIDEKLKDFFESEPDEGPDESIDKEIALKGIDVETEADDDSDEEPLPEDDKGLAPALSALDQHDYEEAGIHAGFEAEGEEDIDQELTSLEEEELTPALSSVETADRQPDKVREETESVETDVNELTQVMLVDEDEEAPEEPPAMKEEKIEEEFVGLEGIPGFGSGEIVEESHPEPETVSEAEDRLDQFFTQETTDDSFIEQEDSTADVMQSKIAGQAEPSEETGEDIDVVFSSETLSEIGLKDEKISEEHEESLEPEDTFHIEDVDMFDETKAELEEDIFSIEKEEVDKPASPSIEIDEKPVSELDSEEVVFKPFVTDEQYEEEVVFQEVKDDDYDIDVDIRGFEEDEKEADEDFVFFEEIEEKKEDRRVSIESATVSGEKGHDLLKPDRVQTDQISAKPSLESLEESIASIGVEVTDDMMKNIVSEINRLTLKFKENSTERKFLSLLSTVLRQVKQSRYGVRSATYTLLQSIFDKLDYVVSSSLGTAKAQELLLEETLKVLLWQQTMLDMRADNEEAGNNLDDLDDLDDEHEFTEDLLEQEGMKDDELTGDDIVGGQDERVSEKVKEKFSTLKDDLQSELDNLRKDLGKD